MASAVSLWSQQNQPHLKDTFAPAAGKQRAGLPSDSVVVSRLPTWVSHFLFAMHFVVVCSPVRSLCIQELLLFSFFSFCSFVLLFFSGAPLPWDWPIGPMLLRDFLSHIDCKCVFYLAPITGKKVLLY